MCARARVRVCIHVCVCVYIRVCVCACVHTSVHWCMSTLWVSTTGTHRELGRKAGQASSEATVPRGCRYVLLCLCLS